MQLKIQRSQKTTMFRGTPVFQLHTIVDVTPEERSMISKYGLASNVVYASEQWTNNVATMQAARHVAMIRLLMVPPLARKPRRYPHRRARRVSFASAHTIRAATHAAIAQTGERMRLSAPPEVSGAQDFGSLQGHANARMARRTSAFWLEVWVLSKM